MYENTSFLSRRWMGMTTRQAGLLAGMAGLNCIVLCVAVYLLTGAIGNTYGSAPTQELLPEDTAIVETILPTFTLTPTVTKTPIGGWREYSGNGMAIMLPDSYIGGDPIGDGTRVKKDLLAAGVDITKIDGLFTQQPPFRFLAYRFAKANDAHPFILIASDPEGVAPDLTSYINAILGMDADKFFFMDRTSVDLDRYTAIRYTVESKTNRTVREYQYFLQDEQKAYWVIAYSSTMAIFADNIADFELSAMTFRAIPPAPPE
jgi:hypothetical protein